MQGKASNEQPHRRLQLQARAVLIASFALSSDKLKVEKENEDSLSSRKFQMHIMPQRLLMPQHRLCPYLLLELPYAMMKYHDQKQAGGREDFFDLCSHITVHHRRTPGQEVKQGRKLKA